MTTETRSDAREAKSPSHGWVVELLSATLLLMAGVATSWSGYQASLWGGIQSSDYARASGIRVDSTRASNMANSQMAVDVSIFMAWTDAYVHDDKALARFYRARFRKEFIPAFDAWLASHPFDNLDASKTPFSLRKYDLAKAEEATRLTKLSESVYAKGQHANSVSDNYVRTAVILALVMLFAGLVQQFRSIRIRVMMLGLSNALFLLGVFYLIIYPKA